MAYIGVGGWGLIVGCIFLLTGRWAHNWGSGVRGSEALVQAIKMLMVKFMKV